jgi:hypothetical protein
MSFWTCHIVVGSWKSISPTSGGGTRLAGRRRPWRISTKAGGQEGLRRELGSMDLGANRELGTALRLYGPQRE